MDFTSFDLFSVQYLESYLARKFEGRAGDPLITQAHDHQVCRHVITLSLSAHSRRGSGGFLGVEKVRWTIWVQVQGSTLCLHPLHSARSVSETNVDCEQSESPFSLKLLGETWLWLWLGGRFAVSPIACHAHSHACLLTCFAFSPTDFRGKERMLAVLNQRYTQRPKNAISTDVWDQ